MNRSRSSARGQSPEGQALDHDAPESVELSASGIDLGVILGALVVLLVLVGLMVWLVPTTLGAGTVNITIRQ